MARVFSVFLVKIWAQGGNRQHVQLYSFISINKLLNEFNSLKLSAFKLFWWGLGI